MYVLEIRSVQPLVRDRAEFADEVIALDVTDEAVHVGETDADGRRTTAAGNRNRTHT